MLDFNHKIYLDGITWTNKAGKTFHFYTTLDTRCGIELSCCHSIAIEESRGPDASYPNALDQLGWCTQ